jgi:hypothetical protein
MGLASDPSRGVVVMFGGIGAAITPYADTWEWNGATWTNVTPAGTVPPGRLDMAMAWFPAHNRVFMHGGVNHALNRAYADAWEWDGAAWTVSGGVPQPFARSGHAIAYDSARARMVLFGGMTLAHNFPNDTWEYDGAAWTNTSTSGPTPRRWAAMAYDAGLGAVVLHGGGQLLTRFDDTWHYNGTWAQASPALTPGARDSHRMVYDTGLGRSVMFGGYNGADLDDTWHYGGPLAASYVNFGQGCAGSAGVPAIQAQGVPTLGTQFTVHIVNLPPSGGLVFLVVGLSNTQWNGLPLPQPLDNFGLPGCSALCRDDASIALLHTNGTAVSTMSLPLLPSLAGLHFFQQALSLDAAAGNAFGGAVSNGGDGTLQ